MSFYIKGTGLQFPNPFISKTETATETLILRRATEELCGNAIVLNENKREVSIAELEQLAAKEKDAAREV